MRLKKTIILVMIICTLISGWFYVRSIIPEILSAGLKPLGNVLIIPVVSYSLLAQLFEFQIEKNDQNTIISRLSQAKYSADEAIMLGNALLIKNALAQYALFYHKLPEDLNTLNLDKSVLNDGNGKKLKYHVDSSFIVLGSCGENETWDANIIDKDIIAKTKSNFIYKINDDLFVGFSVEFK